MRGPGFRLRGEHGQGRPAGQECQAVSLSCHQNTGREAGSCHTVSAATSGGPSTRPSLPSRSMSFSGLRAPAGKHPRPDFILKLLGVKHFQNVDPAASLSWWLFGPGPPGLLLDLVLALTGKLLSWAKPGAGSPGLWYFPPRSSKGDAEKEFVLTALQVTPDRHLPPRVPPLKSRNSTFWNR